MKKFNQLRKATTKALNQRLRTFITELTEKWNGWYGFFIMIFTALPAVVAKAQIKGHVDIMTDKGNILRYYQDNNIEFIYPYEADSLRTVIDSMQVCIETFEKAKQVVSLLEIMGIAMLCISILVGLCALVGWYWKFEERYKVSRKNKYSEYDKD